MFSPFTLTFESYEYFFSVYQIHVESVIRYAVHLELEVFYNPSLPWFYLPGAPSINGQNLDPCSFDRIHPPQ